MEEIIHQQDTKIRTQLPGEAWNPVKVAGEGTPAAN